MKKLIILLGLLMAFSPMFMPFGNAKAAESGNQPISVQDFRSLQQSGSIGEDVNYKDFVQGLKDSQKSMDNLLAERDKQKQQSSNLQSSNLITPSVITNPSGGGFSLAAGDILITRSTSYVGLTGHSGIATSDGYVLHYPGPGAGIQKITFEQWIAKYPHTLVYRQPNRTIANMAASWASSNYWTSNRGAAYEVTTSIYSTNPTYCSKIVWQAYYFGTGSYPVEWVPTAHIAYPYSLIDYINSGYKPTLVFDTY